jgi:hypothetical protein
MIAQALRRATTAAASLSTVHSPLSLPSLTKQCMPTYDDPPASVAASPFSIVNSPLSLPSQTPDEGPMTHDNSVITKQHLPTYTNSPA